MVSTWRIALWLVVQLSILICAAILSFHSPWRRVSLANRLDLIFGYLLAGWISLLSLGVQDPNNASAGYSSLVIGYLLILGLGYWWLRRKSDKAEDVFP
jgi:hypothetical protein